MPQMMPMNWTFMFLYFIFIMIMFNIINFYNFNLFPHKISPNMSQVSNKISWKW